VRPYIHVSDTPPENLSKQPAHAPIKQSGATVPPPANSKAPTRLAAQKREELLREMERHSGAGRLQEQLAWIEENSALALARETASRLVEENSAVQAIRSQFLEMERNPVLHHAREAARWLEENSALTRVLEGFKRHEELARTAMGPLWELGQARLFHEDASWQRSAELAREAIASFESRFRLPDQLESAFLAEQFHARAVQENLAVQTHGLAAQALQQAMEKMSTPWLDHERTVRSVAGFAQIQRIGEAVRTLPAFDDSLAATLRESLGDWRDPITWRPEIFTNLAARGDFYVSLGFDSALTSFPLPAFEQGLAIAGLDGVPWEAEPGEIEEDDIEEVGLARSNAAHDQLQRAERLLRRFIAKHLTRISGPDWPKHRLPNGLYEEWREKKRKAEEAGAEGRPLIEYADFTHYALIICKKDNWREVFQAFFRREESVRETFQRLHPIRLDVAHARLITQDDELLLRAEVMRLEKAMRDEGVSAA
jgi:hypothetical protein